MRDGLGAAVSTLGDSLWQQFGGDVPAVPQAVARDAIQLYGSGRAAARALGVDEKTIRRWKNGETSHSDNVDRLAREARKSRAGDHRGPVEVKFKHANRDRNLTFGAGQGGRGLKGGADADIAQAYIDGDREGMAQALIRNVTDPWYKKQLGLAYVAELGGTPGDAGEKSDAVGMFLG